MGIRNFRARQPPTASAMAGVTSPRMEWATTIPTGPSTASASMTPRITGFSPVGAEVGPSLEHGRGGDAVGTKRINLCLRQAALHLLHKQLSKTASLAVHNYDFHGSLPFLPMSIGTQFTTIPSIGEEKLPIPASEKKTARRAAA